MDTSADASKGWTPNEISIFRAVRIAYHDDSCGISTAMWKTKSCKEVHAYLQSLGPQSNVSDTTAKHSGRRSRTAGERQ